VVPRQTKSKKKTRKVGRPRKIESPAEFDRLVDEYVERCKAEEEPITMTGMALALGFTSREAFDTYTDYEGFSDSVKAAKMIVENAYEKRLHGQNVAGAIFALKNFGWRDRHDLDVTNREDRDPAETLKEAHKRARAARERREREQAAQRAQQGGNGARKQPSWREQ
jgi:hypothetical protein